MSLSLSRLLGGGGAPTAPVFQTNFFSSRTWVAPADGTVVVRAIGAGGGGSGGTEEGSNGSSGFGGGSGAWGCKIVRVKKDDVITATIGSGGAGGPGRGFNGQLGGDTIISINGVDYVAPGGHGGIKGGNSGAVAAALPDTWDFGANGIKGGSKGAGVDILAQGSLSLVPGYSWKTSGNYVPGNLIGDWSQIFYYGDDTEWGLCVVGGQAGVNSVYGGQGGNGGPGADGTGSSTGSASGGSGGICGGGGCGSRDYNSVNGGSGGSGTIGGGGGGGGEPAKDVYGSFGYPGNGGKGGNGYAHLKFFIYLEG